MPAAGGHIDTVHSKRRGHACPCCPGVAFGHKSSLKAHIETVHEKRREENWMQTWACG